MGGHYGSIHVRGDDAKGVQSAVAELAREKKLRFLVAPPIGGWVSVFPFKHGQDDAVGEALAAKLTDKSLIQCLVHDDGLFAYWFFENGVLKDRFNSCPDYFDEKDPEPRGGDATVLAALLEQRATVRELQALLDSEEYVFENERLDRFAELLGLPNAVTAYEYLQDGERDGIQQWRKFIHIPDLRPEQTAKRAAKAKAAAEMKQLANDGLLVREMIGQKTAHSLFQSNPVWCIDPVSNDVLIAWAGSPFGKATPTRVSRINTQTGNTTDTNVELTAHVCRMATSPSGELLAVGCACGDWKTQLWDLPNGKLLAEFPQSRAVEGVNFSRDGQTLYSLSERTLTVVSLSKTQEVQTILLPDGGREMALHPSGEFIVVAGQGSMPMLVQLSSQAVIKCFWIPLPAGPKRELIERVSSSNIPGEMLNKIALVMSADAVQDARAAMKRNFLPQHDVFSLGFGALGNYLFCGTSEGVCVVAWDKIISAKDMDSVDPQAFIRAESLLRDNGSPRNQLIYAVVADSAGKRILFAGLEGKAKFANIADGRIGDLLVPPIQYPFCRLELTPDRMVLVGTAVPGSRERGNKRESPRFQIWNYKALCAVANLAW